MAPAEDYYALLRVSPDAEAAVIRAAYRALMRRHHPDVNASHDAAAQAKAINEAYACLRDADKRAAYDWQRTRLPSHAEPGFATSRPARPLRPRPVWNGPTPRPDPPPPWYKPSWGKAVCVGIAAVITGITFTITSAVPPVAPAVAKPVLEVRMRVASGAAARSGYLQCKPTDAGRPSSAACSS
jgi:hypothetical protein